MTKHVDVAGNRLADRGSIPLISTKNISGNGVYIGNTRFYDLVFLFFIVLCNNCAITRTDSGNLHKKHPLQMIIKRVEYFSDSKTGNALKLIIYFLYRTCVNINLLPYLYKGWVYHKKVKN